MKLFPRHAAARAAEYLEYFPVVVIQGARQVGKSTFASVLAGDRQARQLTLDDATVRIAAAEDPQAFVEQARDGLLVIDEIQRLPELLLSIKAAVDRDRRPGRFLLTGSSDLLRLEDTPDSLAGRAVSLELRGLSQGELHGRLDDFAARITANPDFAAFTTDTTRADYVAALAAGGYPELTGLPGRIRSAWLDSYLERIVRRDATDIVNLSDPARLKRLLSLLAANQAGELVTARVARAADVPPSTVNRDIDLLETLYIIDRLPTYSRNLTKRQTGKAKALLSDSALALRLAGLSERQLLDLTASDFLGPQLEGFVASELLRQRTWSEAEFQLSHFRDSDGPEVDVLIEYSDGTVVALEIKASSTVRSQQLNGLKLLRERLGERFRAGVILNTARTGYALGDRLASLPIAALWEL